MVCMPLAYGMRLWTIFGMDPRAEAVLNVLNSLSDEQLAEIIKGALAEDHAVADKPRRMKLPNSTIDKSS